MRTMIFFVTIATLIFTQSLDSQWNAGTTGTFHLLFLESVTHWHVKISLSSPIYEFDVWVGGNIKFTDSGNTTVEFDNLDWDGDIDVGFVLDVPFRFRYVNNGVMSEVKGIELNGAALCDDGM